MQTAQGSHGEVGQAHAEFSIYDDRGLLAEELTVTSQGGAERSLYDVRRSLIYHAHYFQGRLMLEAIQYYDPLGRLKESRFSGSDDGLMRKHLDRHNQAGQTGEQQSEFYHLSHLRKSVLRYEFDRMGNWIKETVQRWSDKNGLVIPTEADLSRERIITYY